MPRATGIADTEPKPPHLARPLARRFDKIPPVLIQIRKTADPSIIATAGAAAAAAFLPNQGIPWPNQHMYEEPAQATSPRAAAKQSTQLAQVPRARPSFQLNLASKSTTRFMSSALRVVGSVAAVSS